ncbi:MAG: hypothetical protein RMJ48_21500 [Roseiflexaceae bacterium]|nr:hypothetical protein [Roseiflexaceae bacterium]
MSVVNLPQRLTHLAPVSVAAIMALSLACVYASALPLPLRLAGLALFALLTLIQPVGGLVCTALAAPLYLMPTSIDAAGRRWLFPLHEIALLVTTAVMAGQWAI